MLRNPASCDGRGSAIPAPVANSCGDCGAGTPSRSRPHGLHAAPPLPQPIMDPTITLRPDALYALKRVITR
jgi:hypothetical protein